MKKGIIISIILLSIFCIYFSGFICAADFPVAKERYVNDFANVLNSSQSDFLRLVFDETYKNTTAEVVFVSINSLEGYASSDYAIKLFNDWQIGKADKDNGLLILYALTENKIWVTTGYGLEGILPDSKLGRLLDEKYVPMRDSNRTSEGIIDFAIEVNKVINENREEVISGQIITNTDNTTGRLVGILTVFLVFYFMSVILRRIFQATNKNSKNKKKKSGWQDALFWGGVGSSMSGGSSSGGFGGGFGGGGFGGGMSGGGGAGR